LFVSFQLPDARAGLCFEQRRRSSHSCDFDRRQLSLKSKCCEIF
jgi:hypothetical protein